MNWYIGGMNDCLLFAANEIEAAWNQCAKKEKRASELTAKTIRMKAIPANPTAQFNSIPT